MKSKKGGLTAGCIGVISDTHGLLRPEAVEALEGSDLIIHAGDIGSPSILAELRKLAPVIAVRGNTDGGPWAKALPATEAAEIHGQAIYVLHEIEKLDLDPAGRFAAVVSGHSHQPLCHINNGVLFFNPGSAGPRRFRLPITVGRLLVSRQGISGEIIPIQE